MYCIMIIIIMILPVIYLLDLISVETYFRERSSKALAKWISYYMLENILLVIELSMNGMH